MWYIKYYINYVVTWLFNWLVYITHCMRLYKLCKYLCSVRFCKKRTAKINIIILGDID
jgi:hypothetical protein